VKCEVLTSELMRIQVFWNVMLFCWASGSLCFQGTCHIYSHGYCSWTDYLPRQKQYNPSKCLKSIIFPGSWDFYTVYRWGKLMMFWTHGWFHLQMLSKANIMTFVSLDLWRWNRASVSKCCQPTSSTQYVEIQESKYFPQHSVYKHLQFLRLWMEMVIFTYGDWLQIY
jgi:hypothetical protein